MFIVFLFFFSVSGLISGTGELWRCRKTWWRMLRKVRLVLVKQNGENIWIII